MVDFHSHCLPAMDDGARDREESLAMLTENKRQGVDTVVATPHYYSSHESVEVFLERRAAAVEQLAALPEGMHLLLGAEVLLQEGLSSRDLKPLCIEGTRHILIELPFMPPTGWMAEELESIAMEQRLDIILAHVDRYMPWYSREQMELMMDLPALTVQLNAEAVSDWRVYRRLCRWLPASERLVLGTDMHHIDRRRPNLQPAIRRLRHSVRGRWWLALAEETGDKLLYGTAEEWVEF